MLSPQQLELTVREAKARNIGLLDLLVADQGVPEESLAEAFSQWLQTPRVRLDVAQIEPEALRAVPQRLVRRYLCLPIKLTAKHLVLAMANPLDGDALRDVRFASSRSVQPVVACRSEILRAIETHYPSTDVGVRQSRTDTDAAEVFAESIGPRDALDLDDIRSSNGNEPAVDLCDAILREALALQASDIHVEPSREAVRIRFRVDGVLRDHLELPRWLLASLVSRIKVLAKLDIAQQRLPQDGRISTIRHGRFASIRVSTLPTHLGEKVVLRLLWSGSTPGLDELGLSPDHKSTLSAALNQPQGLILVTGPTGAGKSTTLYALLAERKSSAINIVTIEDPVEYQIDGVTQTQIDVKAGLTFATTLRAVLRQDPDVILLGEIRDPETAHIAFQAAMTGHLVLTTLHTNSSVAAVDRLLELELTPGVINAATNVVVAQRLVRRVCTRCRTTYTPSPEALRKVQIDAAEFFRGSGCDACGQTGYAGRVGIFEMLCVTPRLRTLVRRRATEAQIAAAAASEGMRFLQQDATAKVCAGLTTVEEVARVMRVDPQDERALQPRPRPRRAARSAERV